MVACRWCEGRGWVRVLAGVDNFQNDFDGWYMEKVPCPDCQPKPEPKIEIVGFESFEIDDL